MADGELLDAREAMALLGINENELQTLVARGDLRAFRSAGTMKFRRDDVVSVKNEKGTEPTIIIPAQGGRRSSGILPTVGGNTSPRPSSRTLPTVGGKSPSGTASTAPQPVAPAARASTPPKKEENATSDILLDPDFELVSPDDGTTTQHVTVQQPAVSHSADATIVDTSSALDDSVLEPTVKLPSPVAKSEAPSGPATSGRKAGISSVSSMSPAPGAPAPAMSRVRAAVSGSQASASRRTQAMLQARTASPIFTAVLILTTIVCMYSATIVSVMMFRGSYDAETKQRIIPPFLSSESPLPIYQWCYDNTPGRLKDELPKGEYSGK